MDIRRRLYTLPLTLRSLFRRADVERDLDDELRYHVERQTETNIAAGMSASEARTAALRSFGGIEFHKEGARDAWGLRLLENLARDLAHALRIIRKNPGFAAVVVLSLAIGLGATTASFNLTWNVLFAQLAVPHPEQLVMLERVGKDGSDESFSWREFRALSATPGVGTLVAVRGASQISVEAGEAREFVNMDFVDGGFFPMLGLRALRGRLLTPADDDTQAPVVVISERFAARLFPADSPAVGRTVRIRGTPFIVVGVTPRSFRGLEFPGDFTAAIPQSTVALIGRMGAGRDNHGVPFGLTDDRSGDRRAFLIVGRLTVGSEAARAALGPVLQRCCTALRHADERLAVIDIRRGIPGSKDDFRGQARAILTILLAGMGLVLVVVCCNIASLLLVRASARQREIAVRLSLGASRARLVSQLVLENVPLALLGGTLGLVLASWFTAALARGLPPDWDTMTELFRFPFGPAVLVFLVAVTVACGIAFAVYPAFRAIRPELSQALRLDARASRTRGQGTVARGAVVAQVAGTVVLVTAASLLTATLGNLSRVDGGLAEDHLLLTSVEARSTPYEREGVVPLSREIERQVRSVPGVRAAAMSSMVPLFGGSNSWTSVGVPGYTTPSSEPPSVRLIAVTPGWFAVTGIRMITGRDFTAADRAGSEPVAIVNAAFARRYFGDSDPLGRALGVGIHGDSLTTTRILGVAADTKVMDLRSAPEPMVYLSAVQTGGTWSSLQLVVRTEGAPLSMAPTVVRAVDAAAPGINVRRVRDMRSQRDVALAVERLAAMLAAFMSAMALVLSAVGLYGVVAYSTARRTSELGIRIALGASGRAIIWLVQREIMAFVALGVVIGLPLSFAANSALASQLFGVGAHNPALSAGSVLLLVAVALLAGAVPARRAARIDPRIALNAE